MSTNFNNFFFKIKAILQPFESRFPNTWSIKLQFSIIITFCFKNSGKKNLKIDKYSSHTIALSKGTHAAKKLIFWQRLNSGISKN